MIEQALKVLLTSALVISASEAAKRNVVIGAVLASLPLTSLLAMIWLYVDTRDPERVAALAIGIFWLILPSLTLLLVLPVLLRKGVPFVPSILISVALTAASYFAMLAILKWSDIHV
jgi:FtsH-binding integral membrane protein